MNDQLNNISETASSGAQGLLDLVYQYAPAVIGFLVILFITWIIARWVARISRKAFEKAGTDESLARFLANMIKWVVLIVGAVSALSIFGVETASVAAVLASAGIAVGLALQGTLSNFAAGVMLLLFRPFKVGDVVTLDGSLGTVKEIDLFTTHLDTPDNRRVILPNGNVFGSKIENITYNPTRRCDVPVGTSYNADLKETRAILEAAAQNVTSRLPDLEPQIYLKGLGDSSIDWSVRVWCNSTDYLICIEETTRCVKNALDAANINIPYPQVDVHLDKLS